MPSSISSSDIPYREIPDRAWGQAWVICIVLVIAAVAGWELKAREMHHVPGDYDGYTNFTGWVGPAGFKVGPFGPNMGVGDIRKGSPADGKLLVAESGLFAPADLARLAQSGARTFLIGESLMRQDDVTAATRAILADPVPARGAA